MYQRLFERYAGSGDPRGLSLRGVALTRSVYLASGGLNAADFVKLVSVQRVSKRGLKAIARTITTLARAEGLEGHARSIEVRQR